MKGWVFIVFVVSLLKIPSAQSQSLFQRSYTPFFTVLEQEVLSNNDVVVAGTNIANNLTGIPIIRFNSCGHAIWSVRLSSPTNSIDLIDLQIDQQENILLAGNFYISPGERNVFVLSLTKSGTLNYFKVFTSGTSDILYSMDINPFNELLLFFKVNIDKAGPNSRNVMAKLSAAGNLLWVKQYGFTGVWGQICTSHDGGALISDTRNISKIDSSGEVSWNKTFENGFYNQDPLRTQNGYVFFRYGISSSNSSYACMLHPNGELKWNSQLLPNFKVKRGIQRANGNLLFIGDLQIQSSKNNLTLLEIDSSNGEIIRSIIHQENSPLITPVDLNELADGTVFYTAFESLSFGGQIFINRVDANLSRISCQDTSINLNFPDDDGDIFPASPWNAQNLVLPFQNKPLQIDTFLLTEGQLKCSYNPLTLHLGKDTTLCFGSLFTLQAPVNFQGYEWSTMEKTPSILIEKAGTYWLKAWTACDTISDTIQINFYPKTHLQVTQSTDSADVLDSVLFKVVFPEKQQSVVWNFGDGQMSNQKTSTHIYEKSGWLQPKLLLIDTLGCAIDTVLSIYIQALSYSVPNVFTPNGDGINDYFQVVGKGIEEMQTKIFNRWGALIYESSKVPWHGRTSNGSVCDEGIYYYQIRFKQNGNDEQTLKGNVSLVR